MEFVVYILASDKTDKLYKGHTSNLISRFASHNCLGKKGWTIRHRPWRVVHVEFYKTKQEAMQRERFFKTGTGRTWIKEHVQLD
jgi:putative endonuclease